MAKSTNLNLVEEEPQIAESTVSVVEEAAPLQEQIARLEASVQALEARLAAVEQKAHIDHHFELGPNEIAAIAQALKPHTQNTIIEHLKEHLGIAPPAVRGDQS